MIFLRKEDKGPLERRAPLTPEHVARLVREDEIRVTVEPSDVRAFPDSAYREAGATISTERGNARVVLGVKEIPAEKLEPDTVYAFFPHVTKGQRQNRRMLRRLMELGATLVDYEEIVDDAGRRLVFFGRQAGQAGAIDALWALGRRFEHKGIATPFLDVRRAMEYADLDEAKRGIAAVGERIATEGLPDEVRPVVLGVAGYGNTGQGALEIFRLLRSVSVRVFREEDTVEPVDADVRFDLDDFRANPERYRSRFDAIWPDLTLLLNGVFWRPGCPRLVSLDGLSRLHGGSRLEVIGDVSCDIEGSIECTVHVTTPEDPVYVYDPETRATTPGVAGRGPVILAVDNLPCELPVDASRDFGDSLLPFVPALARCDWSEDVASLQLPAELKRAIVVLRGALTPAYAHLDSMS